MFYNNNNNYDCIKLMMVVGTFFYINIIIIKHNIKLLPVIFMKDLSFHINGFHAVSPSVIYFDIISFTFNSIAITNVLCQALPDSGSYDYMIRI